MHLLKNDAKTDGRPSFLAQKRFGQIMKDATILFFSSSYNTNRTLL